MNTMTLQIDNPSIIPSLRKVLNAIEGVVILPQRKATAAADEPNATTVKAIKDVRSGKTYKASSVDDLLTQCLQ